MQRYLKRGLEGELLRSLRRNPVTALVGPRQCGKSTLARRVLADKPNALLLDLELPSDLRKLDDPELFLSTHGDRLIGIDEVQRRQELFPVLRALVDRDRRPGRFLLLGSASRDLIHQAGETLAGRIHYVELAPFSWDEVRPSAEGRRWGMKRLWWRGGFPPAYLTASEAQSQAWRRDLMLDYLSRDLPAFGYSIPQAAMGRFWRMLAHSHGSTLNASKLGQALDISHTTVRKYIDILEQTFMVRVIRPMAANLKKRLVKAPKVYLRDSGLLHTLLEIETEADLFGHPAFGASWEGWCVEQIVSSMPLWQPSYWRTSSGEEVDLILQRGRRRLAFEFKASLSPRGSRGFQSSLELLQPDWTWVVCPMEGDAYAMGARVEVAGLSQCLDELKARWS